MRILRNGKISSGRINSKTKLNRESPIEDITGKFLKLNIKFHIIYFKYRRNKCPTFTKSSCLIHGKGGIIAKSSKGKGARYVLQVQEDRLIQKSIFVEDIQGSRGSSV